MFKLQIEPWDQVKNINISTLHTAIELKEEGDFVVYELKEYSSWQFVEYEFKVTKRQNYKEYVKMFAEINVDVVDLKNLVGAMSFFREVYQYAIALFRKGVAADVAFKWRDGDVLVAFNLYAVRSNGKAEVQSKMRAERGGEYLLLLRGEVSEHAEEDLERHVKEAVGLYMLFKEYTAPQQEASKT